MSDYFAADAALAAQARSILAALRITVEAMRTPTREMLLQIGALERSLNPTPSPEQIQRAYLDRKPMRRLVLVGGCGRSTADEYRAATDDGRDPEAA